MKSLELRVRMFPFMSRFNRHEKSEGNCKQLLSLRRRRRTGGEGGGQVLSCCKPLNRLTAGIEQQNP